MNDRIDALIEAEKLPDDYREIVNRFWRPLAFLLVNHANHAEIKRPLLVGVNGAQGSGKSTLCRFLEVLLPERGLSCVTLSLDDFYLTRAGRDRLARETHPLFATRGVPGTHDVALVSSVIDRLLAGRAAEWPRFDKARDDRANETAQVSGAVDLVLFEGWCVGAVPQPATALLPPVNRLEAEEDPDAIWRREVNRRLANDYAELFGRLDLLVMLKVPGFDTVKANRLLQEQKLARSRARGTAVMDEAAIVRFIAHYERLTRWMLAEMPDRADIVFELDARQRPCALPSALQPGPGHQI